MFREVYTHPFSYIRQSSIGGIEQHVRSYIVLWSHPLAFEYAPKCFGNVQLWRIWWQVEKKETSLFPSYSLQKSSAIQYISVTLLTSFIEGCFFVICLIFNNKYTKNNPLFGLFLKLF